MATVDKKIRKEREKEKFDSEKIERSLHYIGIDEHTAREIAWKVPERDGITTYEIRKIVVKELREKDPELAELYLSTRRLSITTVLEAVRGVALLKKETLARMRMVPGENIDILHRGERHTLKVEHAPLDRHEIGMHAEDLRELGVSDGKRITVQRSK